MIYSGLSLFKEGKRLQNVLEVPGVTEGGWTNYHLYKGSSERDKDINQKQYFLQEIINYYSCCFRKNKPVT